MPILKNQTKWEDLFYYRKSVVLYQIMSNGDSPR